MSAVPKKKLCWNCEGNVARNIDNCPYCGVYLHSTESEEGGYLWNLSYRPKQAEEDDASNTQDQNSADALDLPQDKMPSSETEEFSFSFSQTLLQFKKDLLPVLLLMSGSLFFLFGAVLFLFSDGGHLTLQWEEDNWVYFIGFSIPATYFGWKLIQQTDLKE